MKKLPLVTSIISALLSVAAAVLLFFLPKLSPELASLFPDYLNSLKGNLFSAFKSTIGFGIGNAVISSILVGLVAIVLILWLWHFIMLCATRRADSLPINLIWLVFGACSAFVLFSFIGYTKAGTGYVFEGELGGDAFHNGFSLISALFKDGFVKHAAAICILIGILALAIISFANGLISVIGAIHDDRCNPHEAEENTISSSQEEKETDENGDQAPQDSRSLLEDTENKGEGKDRPSSPLIVQNITYAPAPSAANALQTPTPSPATPSIQEEKKETPLTEEGLKKILSELMAEKKEPVQATSSPTPKEEKPLEERPLTAKELRSIIKNELRDHDHPEELLPLTDEQCRSLIREELNQYYASTRPASEKREDAEEEQKEATPATASQKEEMEEDFMTAEELSKMIRNEVIQVVDEQPKEESLTLDMVKDAIHEALSSYQPKVETLKKEDVQAIVKEELASTKEELSLAKEENQKQNEAIASSRQQALQAEYEAKLVAAKNENAIERLKESQLSADDIRAIISEELDKKISVLEKEPVAEAPKEEALPMEKKEETAPAQAPVLSLEEEEERRIPFANRLLSLDDDIKEYYNLLKEEALSYGLKSRLSISGDTFRLHTKTYLKIAVAGKGLKLYMALDPSAYKDSSIPVKDAGTKNLYRDIPLVFKVKSPLSLRRAKTLIKDVCEKDGLKQAEITPYDYVAQLSSYRVAGTEEEE